MNTCVKYILLRESLRHFSLTTAINKSHYDSLGVNRKATQTEIKNAYYKLSMLYHPDKNKGSDEAAKKFRDISEAYEVLGNLKLRKLYDKGMLHTAGTEFSSYDAESVPENKFYKSREQRSKPPAPTGRSDAYNFDEWTRAHYEETFERTQQNRSKKDMKEKLNRLHSDTFQSEMVLYSMLAVIIVFLAFFRGNDDLDKPAPPKKTIPNNSN